MRASTRQPAERSDAETSGRFAAFSSVNFRRYFIGQMISSVGSWTQTLAVTWLILEIAQRSDLLGLAMALQFLPMLVLGAPAGVLADKVDNRRLLLTTSAISGALAIGFAAIVATDRVSMWSICTLTTALGIVLAVERPTMQAIVYQLAGPDLLPSAVAANSNINAASRLVGPALAGGLIALFGVEICFVLNGASYLIVIVALLGLRSADLVPRPRTSRAKGQLRAGFAYVRANPDVSRPLLIMAVVGTIALNFPTTFPSMVHFGFHLDAGAVGTAMSVSAIGSILGGIYIGGLRLHPQRSLTIALIGFGVACLALALAPGYWAFVLLSIPLGFASASFQSVNTITVQRATEPSMQGRVMALHQMALFGSTPIGALLMGGVIHLSSPRVPFVMAAVAALGSAVIGRRRVRGPGGDRTHDQAIMSRVL